MTNLLLLLADGERSDQFVKGFREGTLTRTPIHVVLILAVVALAVAVACYIVERFKASRRTGPVSHPGKLFRELCRLHRLNRGSVRVLKRLACESKLASLCEVFVRPELFKGPAESELRGKLFGGARSVSE